MLKRACIVVLLAATALPNDGTVLAATAQAAQLVKGLSFQLPANLSAQQACAAQAVLYLRERRAAVEQLAETFPHWNVFLDLGAPPYTAAKNHYNQQLHRCLVAVSTVENDRVKDDLTKDVTERLTHIEIVDPFEQASILTCADPIPTHLIDTRTGKTTLFPSSHGWKCWDAERHQLDIEEGMALMARLMRE
jgi:hypothetical protein